MGCRCVRRCVGRVRFAARNHCDDDQEHNNPDTSDEPVTSYPRARMPLTRRTTCRGHRGPTSTKAPGMRRPDRSDLVPFDSPLIACRQIQSDDRSQCPPGGHARGVPPGPNVGSVGLGACCRRGDIGQLDRPEPGKQIPAEVLGVMGDLGVGGLPFGERPLPSGNGGTTAPSQFGRLGRSPLRTPFGQP